MIDAISVALVNVFGFPNVLVVLFGTIGLMNLPKQLTPDVETPEITVRTVWPGATPTEVKQEIIEKHIGRFYI